MEDTDPLLMSFGSGGNDSIESAAEMDKHREIMLAYEYLCHLEEAKKWLEACLQEELPPAIELEENLRNGVYLAMLCHFIAPDNLPLNKIYDLEQEIYAADGLQFSHIHNINNFLQCLKAIHFPLIFQPELTDIYDRKNMPYLIYCIHALSAHLFEIGKAPQIEDLHGKVIFPAEEINAVSSNLKKYGVRMPVFQKIGELLTNEMPEATAALEAAVIAINRALDVEVEEMILETLGNSAAQLTNFQSCNVIRYWDYLSKAKETKIQAALYRSLSPSFVRDAYDEVLTQAEIQEQINIVNVHCALEAVVDAIPKESQILIEALNLPVLELENVRNENVTFYGEEISDLMKSSEWKHASVHTLQRRDLMQSFVDTANIIADISQICIGNVAEVNYILENGNATDLMKLLKESDFGVSKYTDEYAAPLYYDQMKMYRSNTKKDLPCAVIIINIRIVSYIAAVSKAVDSGDPDLMYEALSNPDILIADLEVENKMKYYNALSTTRVEKIAELSDCPLLTHGDIQECINIVNQYSKEYHKVIQALHELTMYVVRGDRISLVKALKDPLLKLTARISPCDASLYLKLFKKCLRENDSDESELSFEDVHNVAEVVESEVQQITAECSFLRNINIAVVQDDPERTLDVLQSNGYKVLEKYRLEYYLSLRSLRLYKRKQYWCPYIRFVTRAGNEVFFDLNRCIYTWDKPQHVATTKYIDKDDIEGVFRGIGSFASDMDLSKVNLHAIIKLQAAIRGYLLRKEIADTFKIFNDKVRPIIKIQAWWRGVIQRKRYIILLAEKSKAENCPNEQPVTCIS